jgi:magnesium-transporting ATPase (P-type)
MYNRKSPPRLYNNVVDHNKIIKVEPIHGNSSNNNDRKQSIEKDKDSYSVSNMTTTNVAEQVWKELIDSDSTNAITIEEGLSSSSSSSLSTHLKTGWTTDQALQRRERDGSFNVVKPPVDCPAWLCILLPCIKHIPSMKVFASIQPDDAEVLRNGKWIRYDAASLVTGDVIRLEEGDLIPADCVVVVAVNDGDGDDNEDDLLVDVKAVTGHERPKTISVTSGSRSQRQLYMGGKVVQGRATALVTSTGPRSLLGTLIQDGKFPPKEPILEVMMDAMATPGSSGSPADIQLGIMS